MDYLTLILSYLPILVPALYVTHGLVDFLAYLAARFGFHVAWAHLAGGMIHAGLGALYYLWPGSH